MLLYNYNIAFVKINNYSLFLFICPEFTTILFPYFFYNTFA